MHLGQAKGNNWVPVKAVSPWERPGPRRLWQAEAPQKHTSPCMNDQGSRQPLFEAEPMSVKEWDGFYPLVCGILCSEGGYDALHALSLRTL